MCDNCDVVLVRQVGITCKLATNTLNDIALLLGVVLIILHLQQQYHH